MYSVDKKNLKIGIVGAGIQGVCNALFLQKKGFEVTLFDREEPGNAASYGNAGHFSPYASVPLNRPDVIADVPSMLVSSRGPLELINIEGTSAITSGLFKGTDA